MSGDASDSGLPTVAYLAEGKLYVKTPDAEPRVIESKFANDLIDRQTRDAQRNEWKAGSMSWNTNTMQPDMMMGMQLGTPGGVRQVRITTLAAGDTADELHYTVRTSTVGALFHYTLHDGYETRLSHDRDFAPMDLDRHVNDGSLVCCLRYHDMSSNIALMDADGSRLREITEGDSIDEAPSWVRGPGGRLVYQSAGIARDQHGSPYATSVYGVELLDTESGDMKTLVVDAGVDYLLPRMTEDGTLYCVRRPHQPYLHPPRRWRDLIRDVLMFPIGFVLTLVSIFDWISKMLRDKPLLTAGGPRRTGPKMTQMFVLGRWLAVQQDDGSAPQPVVPRDWQLIRRDPDGAEHEIASSVLSYDLLDDGRVVYTNGRKVMLHDPQTGKDEKLCAGVCIERVVGMRG